MSWWDSKGFSNLASQALKKAQKQIDQVLDIDAGDEGGKTKASGKTSKVAPVAETSSTPEEKVSNDESNSWNSWSSWLSPKQTSADSHGAEGDKSGDDTSDATSSWSFSWGSLGDDSSKPDSTTSSSPSKGHAALSKTSKPSSAAARKLGLLSDGDSKQKKSSIMSKDEVVKDPETESIQDEKSKKKEEENVEEIRLTPESSEESGLITENAGQSRLIPEDVKESTLQLVEEARPAEDSMGESRLSPEDSKMSTLMPGNEEESKHDAELSDDRHEVSDDMASQEEPCAATAELKDSPAAEKELVSESSRAMEDEVELSETGKCVLASGQDIACELAEGDISQISTTPESAVVAAADSSKPDLQLKDIVLETTDDVAAHIVASAISDSVNSSFHQVQADPDSGKAVDAAGSVSAESESNVSQISGSMEETFETVPKESSSGDSAKDIESDMASVSASGSEDTLISREASFTQISASEDLQEASMCSVSSDPVLLSISTDDNTTAVQQEDTMPDEGLFNPPGSQGSESEHRIRRSSSPLDEQLPQDESSSSVCSPYVDSVTTASSTESSETSRLDSSVDTVVDQHHKETDGEDVDVEEVTPGQHWMGESSLADLDSASSPSASFVKCMIEDAMDMEDASKQEDSGSDNHSEEKSESSKVDSEFEKSMYSGHESSDDIETTTSSDIEIISTPTPNGEKNIVDLSPLKFSLQKAARGQGLQHRRSDSQSSSSTHSKGDVDHLSLERDSDHERQDWHGDDDDHDNPQHPQRLLKSSKTQQEKDVVKKLAEMAEILQARETKLVQLSKDNNDLLETNSILRSQLQQAEDARDSELTDLNALTEEFSRRMGESERKIQTILKEKETLKQQLQVAQTSLAKKSEDTGLEALLAEKEEQITGLLEEGEKLSKQQLQNSNIIKKLRAKEKENEGLLASQKKKLDKQKEELDKLKVVLDSKEDMEKKQAEAIKQLNAAVQSIEKEKMKLKVEVESSDEKIRGLQTTLDNSYKEIAELHKSNATQDSRAQQAALSAEMQVREELKMAMEEQEQRYLQEREAFIIQIEDLRLSLARMEKESNRREEMLKQENSDLQMRLQEDECRGQDLTHSVTAATRPLLRQIENLQATHSIQASAWEKVEKSLTERLTEAQTLLALAQEKERAAVDKLSEVTSRCTALESSNSQLRQEKAMLLAQQESDKRRIDMLEERRANDVAQLEMAKQKLSEDVAHIRKDKVFLEQQLESERNRVEMEKQRVSVVEEQLRIMEKEHPRSRGTPSPVSVSRQESMNSSFSERSATPTWLPKPDEIESHFPAANAGSKGTLYDSMRHSGAAALIENLQSQLKLREGEISQLQAEIQQLERTRESMARELVNLTNQNEELKEDVKELPKLQATLKDLDSRYNAVLQMYGEKEERVQELMLDLEDVKEMYKQQINSLLQ